MRKISTATLVAAALFCLGVGAPARANTTTISFNFNALSANESDSAISSTLTSQLKTQLGCTTCAVTVTGAAADTTYNADGHVTGTSTTSTNLGTGGNVFLSNTTNSTTQLGSSFSIQFTGGVSLSSASFNYEIFPDGTAQQPPDFIFDVNAAPLHTWYGVAPGNLNSPACHGQAGASSCGAGSVGGKENNYQVIGATGTLTFGPTVNPTLTFLDWPATIGMDHLVVTTPSPTPEPGTMLLLGTGLISIFGLKRKKQQSQTE